MNLQTEIFMRRAEDIGNTRMKNYFYPKVDKTKLFAEGYIDAKSGYSRGSTLDLTLFDMKIGNFFATRCFVTVSSRWQTSVGIPCIDTYFNFFVTALDK